MVYVLNIDGQPLMPTDRHGKVRHLLKDGRAEVVKCCPFTIRLLYDSTHYTQDIVLGVDAGSKHIGLSATTETKELYTSDVELRNDIVDLISTRRQNRRSRRNQIYELQGIEIRMTFGYLTKNTRIRHHLPKEHYIDARCISGHPEAIPSNEVFYQKKVRCHNRQIHKNTILKGGIRKRNQTGYLVKGFRLFDKDSSICGICPDAK